MPKDKPKAIGLIGVKHTPKKSRAVIGVILSNAHLGQSIGLEVPPDVLTEFKKIFARQQKKKVSFETAFLPHFKKMTIEAYEAAGVSQKQIARLKKRLKGKIKVGNLTDREKESFNSWKFWFQVYEAITISNKGLRAVALENKHAQLQTEAMFIKEEHARSETKQQAYRKLKLHLLIPIREKWMARIKPEKVDFMVVGLGHVEGLKDILNQKNVKANIIFGGKGSPLARREESWLRDRYQARKQRMGEARQRYLQGKISRKKLGQELEPFKISTKRQAPKRKRAK